MLLVQISANFVSRCTPLHDAALQEILLEAGKCQWNFGELGCVTEWVLNGTVFAFGEFLFALFYFV